MQTFPHKKWNPFIQLDFHKGIFLTGPIPVPGGAWHIGGGVLAMPFIYLGTPKHNECKVLANGMEVVSRGHEPKYLIIPHWNLFPPPFVPACPNILIPLLLLTSSNKCQFAVGSVVGKDGPIAVSIFKYVGINQACQEFCTAPTSITFNWGTVELGFTLGDLVSSLLCFAFDSLKSFLEYLAFSKLAGFLPKGLFKNQMKSLLGRLGLPKIFRGAGGRFASMSERLVGEGLTAAGKALYGEMFGGGNLGQATGFDSIDPVNMVASAAGEGADRLGAWIDGRSESFYDYD